MKSQKKATKTLKENRVEQSDPLFQWFRTAPRLLLVIFFAILLPEFIINLLSTHNYLIATFIGGILAMYIAVFAMRIAKYIQYKNNKK